MKLFRRIFALALNVVMICLFSASAFAATTFSDLEMYDDNETYVDVYAQINERSTSGYLALTAVGLSSHRAELTLSYEYTNTSNEDDDGYSSRVYTEDTYCPVSSAGTNIKRMKEADYIFYVWFSSWIGENEYNSGSQTITYPAT